MDTQLRDQVFQRLAGDSALDGLLHDVASARNPEEPKHLPAPVAVVDHGGGPEAEGRHGAATDDQLEIKLWGYGTTMEGPISKAAQRIDELLLKGITFDDGSVAMRFRSVTGWTAIPDTDPRTIHKQNTYVTRYWSAGRIAILSGS